MTAPLRAVVADDSVLFRALLVRSLASLGGVEVVGQAKNGAEAVELVRQLGPDLLTLDLNMPVLDGLGALRAMREAKSNCEVIVVSSETQQGAAVTLEALQLGAVDFITKPAAENALLSAEALCCAMRRQLAVVRMRRDRRQQLDGSSSKATVAAVVPASQGSIKLEVADKRNSVGSLRVAGTAPEIIAIGSSTGGPAALPVLLGGLPATLPVAVLIVQHMPPLFTACLADSLGRKCALQVVEGREGQAISPGHVYLAPGGRHMKVRRARDQTPTLQISDEPPENFCRPSVDTLFRSVSEVYGGRVIAAILTGMGNDGVAGLRLLKTLGARVLAQDEATCTVFGMPQEAIRAAVVDQVLPLGQIAPWILKFVLPNAR